MRRFPNTKLRKHRSKARHDMQLHKYCDQARELIVHGAKEATCKQPASNLQATINRQPFFALTLKDPVRSKVASELMDLAPIPIFAGSAIFLAALRVLLARENMVTAIALRSGVGG